MQFMSASLDPWTYFAILGLAIGAIAIIGLLVERKALLTEVKTAKAEVLATVTGVTKMRGPVSNEFTLTSGEPPAPGPAIIIEGVMVGNMANLKVGLPATDNNGQPLKSLSKLYVYATEESFLGTLEALAGLEPHVTIDLNISQAGQVIPVSLEVPKFKTDYHFYAVPE